TTTPAEICLNKPNIPVCATPADPTGYINWYGSLNATTKLKTNQLCYTPEDKTMPGEYTLYATETVNDCESEKAPVEYTIKDLPNQPTIAPISPICQDVTDTVLTASGDILGTIEWFKNDGVTPVGTGNTFTHVIIGAGIQRYKVRQEVDGCKSPFKDFSFEIIQTPTMPVAASKAMCENDEQAPTFNTGDNRTIWYTAGDLSNSSQVEDGQFFIPARSTITNADKTYYIINDDQGCRSVMNTVVLDVIEKPEFDFVGLSSKCVYDDGSILEIENLEPALKNGDEIYWYFAGSDIESENQVVNIDLDEYFTDPSVNPIRARYEVAVDGRSPCRSDMKSFTYTVHDYARKPIILGDVICQGEDIDPLRAIGSQNITWVSYDTGDENDTLRGSTRYFFDPYLELDTGTYRFRIWDIDENTGCRSEYVNDSMILAPAATPEIIGSDSVCAFDSEVRYYTNFVEGSDYIWTITDGGIMYMRDDRLLNIRHVDWTTPGYDTIVVTEVTWAQCIEHDTLFVKTAPYPEPYFSLDRPGAEDVVRMIDSTTQDSIWEETGNGIISDFITYDVHWNFGKNVSDYSFIDTTILYENVEDPLFVPDYKPGTWNVYMTAENSFGCKAQYTDDILITIQTGLYVPSALAPMNPAHGVRYFEPKAFNVEAMEVYIYDVWGNLVWYSNEVENNVFVGKWDGRYNGKILKSDSYIWKINATFIDGQTWKGVPNGRGGYDNYGSVLLIR
ncbi:MAG: hypothetical protein PF481_05245, partial [Bacteroidales bacterium]|nr:hypothetical protein [Bacteroidales bacterium]